MSADGLGHVHTVFGLRIVAPVPLRWADAHGVLDPAYGTITVDTVSTGGLDSMRDHPISVGDEACRLERLADRRLLADTADAGPFVLDGASSHIDAPIESVTDPEWEHRLLAYALPYLLGELGMLILHGAVVETAAGAVVILGPSGRGKSTLTMAAVGSGHRVLGDDGVRITFDPADPGRPIAWPGLSAARSVRHNAAGRVVGKDTHELPSQARCAQPLPVAAIVALSERSAGGSPLCHLGNRDRVGAILQSTFAERDSVARVFPSVAALARAVPVAKISVRDDRALVSAELARILDVTLPVESDEASLAGSRR